MATLRQLLTTAVEDAKSAVTSAEQELATITGHPLIASLLDVEETALKEVVTFIGKHIPVTL